MTRPPGYARLFQPTLDRHEVQQVDEVISAEWLGMGPKLKEFEQTWEKRLNASALALNSCSAALHLAMDALELPRGSKVLVPSLTFAATALAPLHCDLEVVLVDSDPVTLTIDLADLEAKYDENCVAVMVVHYAGHPAPMEEIAPWAESRGLAVIEDCAHTIGSLYLGRPLGTWGDYGCFSFEEKKIMTTGDGGLLVARDAKSLAGPRLKRWLGIDRDSWRQAARYLDPDSPDSHWFYEVPVRGFKYNMNDLAAAVGLGQLAHLDEMLGLRSERLSEYVKWAKEIGVETLVPYDPSQYAYQMFGVRVDDRPKVMRELKMRGIATGSHYTPLSRQPILSDQRGTCPYVEREADRLLTLPFHARMTRSDVDFVMKGLMEAITA